MEIKYKKQGNYYIPDLKLEKENNSKPLGRFGLLRLNYLKEHHKSQYTLLLMTEELTTHLQSIDEEAKNMYELLIKQLAEKEKINENLKQSDQLKWVQMMNNIKNSAEEIVLNELIYTEERRRYNG